MSQRRYSSAEFAFKKKRTRRETLLADMERVVPWAPLVAVVEPLYAISGVGCHPMGVSKTQLMHLLQLCYDLADEEREDAVYGSQAMRDCVDIDLSCESVPDATTLLQFRLQLVTNDLTEELIEDINAHLVEQGLLLRAGNILDAIIIAAPSSTENASSNCDPELHYAK